MLLLNVPDLKHAQVNHNGGIGGSIKAQNCLISCSNINLGIDFDTLGNGELITVWTDL